MANHTDGTVSRVRASDGKLLETWTGADNAYAVLVAYGRVLVAGRPDAGPAGGKLYMIDPSQPAGSVTTAVDDMTIFPMSLAFDGKRIWAAGGLQPPLGVAIITPASAPPWPVAVITGPSFQFALGAVFDGQNVWTSQGSGNSGSLLKLDSSGNVLQTVPLDGAGGYPAFDGANIWAPGANGSVTVVSASSGNVVGTLPGLGTPRAAAFDGQRILVVAGTRGALFRAADLGSLGSFTISPSPVRDAYEIVSDGINFWLTIPSLDEIARF
ncbi:MAG: hypothetical protein WAU32_16630 [Thermoanaerobaculia bacterium]